jgi:hypothetical protein
VAALAALIVHSQVLVLVLAHSSVWQARQPSTFLLEQLQLTSVLVALVQQLLSAVWVWLLTSAPSYRRAAVVKAAVGMHHLSPIGVVKVVQVVAMQLTVVVLTAVLMRHSATLAV